MAGHGHKQTVRHHLRSATALWFVHRPRKNGEAATTVIIACASPSWMMVTAPRRLVPTQLDAHSGSSPHNPSAPRLAGRLPILYGEF